MLDEFSEIIESSVSSNLGGMAFAQKTLELAHGDYRANNMMNRIAPVRDSLDFMDDVNEMESGQIYNVLRFEQPQTIAFVLANVDSDKSSEVLLMMAPHIQEQVIERIGSMETTPTEQVQLVADTEIRNLIILEIVSSNTHPDPGTARHAPFPDKQDVRSSVRAVSHPDVAVVEKDPIGHFWRRWFTGPVGSHPAGQPSRWSL